MKTKTGLELIQERCNADIVISTESPKKKYKYHSKEKIKNHTIELFMDKK